MTPAIGQRWSFKKPDKATQYVAEIIGIDERRCIMKIVQVIDNDDVYDRKWVYMENVFIAETLIDIGPVRDWWTYLDGQDRPN